MTVRELIHALEDCDQDLPVEIKLPGHFAIRIGMVEVRTNGLAVWLKHSHAQVEEHAAQQAKEQK